MMISSFLVSLFIYLNNGITAERIFIVTAQQFNIMSIPTLMVFKKGEKVKESVGLIPKEEIEALLA